MPRTCPCCAVPVAYGAGSPLCESCLPQLHSALARVERVQVLQPLDGAVVPEVRAASRYEGMMPRALLALKNAGRTDLLPLLGEGLARSVYELLRAHREGLHAESGSSIPVEVLLVPAPSSAQSVRRRGYAPANLLVQEAARQLNRRLPASVRVRAVDVIGYVPRGRRGAAPPYLLVWALLFSVLLRQRMSRRAWALWGVPSGCTVPCVLWNLPCARVG